MTRRILTLVFMLGLVCAFVPAVHAQSNQKAELKARFNERKPQLREQKQEGRIGETLDGYVDVVDPRSADEKIKNLVEQENDDRRSLYNILAEEINQDEGKGSVTAATVAARNALRNIEKASPDEFLRVAKDHWIRIRDFSRFEALRKAKGKGLVGETSEGLVEAVKPDDLDDQRLARQIKEENDARTDEYKRQAGKENVEVSVIARRMAERNFENARVGDMLKDEAGNWRQK